MLTINWKYVYEINNKWILILYDISKNHYVGLPIYGDKIENSIFLKSINKYVILNEITDYNRNAIRKCIYIKGMPLIISNDDFNNILLKAKNYFLNNIKINTDSTSNGISYCKWCNDKLVLMNKNCILLGLKIGAICWVDLGYNIGNELRKLRPAILWRSTSNKEMWTIIPLTSKHKNDSYYFHYDLENDNLGTAKIENLMNISSKRIKEPYFIKNKIATITKNDNDIILRIIKKYYAFDDIEISIKIDNKKDTEKVLT